MASKKSRSRKTYSDALRTSVMSTAAREGLTAAQVEKRFGVTPVTYYSWRRKDGLVGNAGRGRPVTAAASPVVAPAVSLDGEPIPAQVRAAIQTRVRAIAVEIVGQEIEALFK